MFGCKGCDSQHLSWMNPSSSTVARGGVGSSLQHRTQRHQERGD